MTAAALGIVVLGIALVRLGWGGRRGLAIAGWALAAAATVVLATQDGAWSVALGIVVAMTAALAIVLLAGWRSPARTYRAPREAPSVLPPRRLSGVARRLAVFVLSVPVACAASFWLAYGVQAAGRRAGLGESDATATVLMLAPVIWVVVVTVQLTRAAPARMIAAPAVAALAGTALWSIA